jgi:transcriptional regulator with XRE-family HTH domain
VSLAPPVQIALGRAVKARRDELGLTQEQLALRGGLQQKWISNVETGKRDLMYSSLRRLAPVLDLTTAELIERAEASERDPDAADDRDSLAREPTAG